MQNGIKFFAFSFNCSLRHEVLTNDWSSCGWRINLRFVTLEKFKVSVKISFCIFRTVGKFRRCPSPKTIFCWFRYSFQASAVQIQSNYLPPTSWWQSTPQMIPLYPLPVHPAHGSNFLTSDNHILWGWIRLLLTLLAVKNEFCSWSMVKVSKTKDPNNYH